MALYIKWRPKHWSELVGHPQLVKSIELMRSRGSLGGKAYMLTGSSGIGKSTAARLIAMDVCDEDNIIELDCSGLMPSTITDLERSLRPLSIGEKPGRAVVLNECHGLRKDTIRQLLVTLERIPKHVAWVLTTTNEGQKSLFEGIDADPLLSRCIRYHLDGKHLLPFAIRVREIAQAEGLDGQPLDRYIDLARDCRGNMREMLCRVESGELLI